MASIEDKFNAAVQSIKKLPKDGPFQPSYDMMKKFYGLFKQATEGPCNEPRPAFWNAIKKVKWEAWSCLGDMSKVRAQEQYVTEMLKIIEAMPQTEEVRHFLSIIGPFFELVTMKEEKTPNGGIPNGDVVHIPNDQHNGSIDDDEMPEIRSKINGADTELNEDEQNNPAEVSLLATAHQDSLTVGQLSNGHIKKQNREILFSDEESFLVETTAVFSDSHPIYVNEDQTHDSAEGDSSSSSGTDDEFCDSIDQPDISMERKVRFADSEPLQVVGENQPLTSTPMIGDRITTEAEIHNIPGSQPILRTNHSVQISAIPKTPVTDPAGGTRGGHLHLRKTSSSEEMSEHIALVLERLQRDMNSVLVRLNTLETVAVTPHQGSDSEVEDKDTWWPFSRLDTKSVVFILVWPFVVNWIIKFMSRRQPRK